MADRLYTDETVVVYFEAWDGEVSTTKPTTRPHAAWLDDGDVAEITLTVKKPGETADEVLTLTDDEVEPSGRAGEWRAYYNTDGGAGYYHADFRLATVDDKYAVSVTTVRARNRPS